MPSVRYVVEGAKVIIAIDLHEIIELVRQTKAEQLRTGGDDEEKVAAAMAEMPTISERSQVLISPIYETRLRGLSTFRMIVAEKHDLIVMPANLLVRDFGTACSKLCWLCLALQKLAPHMQKTLHAKIKEVNQPMHASTD